jgi:hypothetical protein
MPLDVLLSLQLIEFQGLRAIENGELKMDCPTKNAVSIHKSTPSVFSVLKVATTHDWQLKTQN